MKLGKIEISVFVCGAIVMILEITGSRIFAPFLGTSLFVWTGLIGIILASLSIGYFVGGRLSEKNDISLSRLGTFIFLAGLAIAITAIIQRPFLIVISGLITDIRFGVSISALVLLSPASFFLGIVSPYANRLKIKTVESAGEVVGNLSAISTIGSIFGTFFAGFILLNYFGSSTILWGLSLSLMALAIFIKGGLNAKKYIAVFGATILLSVFCNKLVLVKDLVLERDTLYSHVLVYDRGGVRTLQINKERHSEIYLDNDNLVFPYTKVYLLAGQLLPQAKKTLMLGGGAYTFPKYFLKTFPKTRMDVVEIDPDLKPIAESFFGLKTNNRMSIYHQDARIFLNSNQKRYDIVFGDAFSSWYSLPYHLTTTEAIKKISNSLNDDGIFILNIISALEGNRSQFLDAEYATVKTVFPFVYIFPVEGDQKLFEPQNIMIMASKKDFKMDDKILTVQQLKLKEVSKIMANRNGLVLTDDHAPVENMIAQFMQ